MYSSSSDSRDSATNTSDGLLEEAERRVKKLSNTSKIELTLIDSENLDYYENKGYKKEAVLENHYRWNETCYILSKSFSNFYQNYHVLQILNLLISNLIHHYVIKEGLNQV